MRRRGRFLQVYGAGLLLMVPFLLVTAPTMEVPPRTPSPAEVEAIATQTRTLTATVGWLAPNWQWFVERTVSRWRSAETDDELAEAGESLHHAVSGLRRIYRLRVLVWATLGLFSVLVGTLVVAGRGHPAGLLVIVAWLGGSPLPEQISTLLPDDNDALLLAGMLPMLVAASVVLQHVFRRLASLARTRPRLGRPLILGLMAGLFGLALTVTIATGGLDEYTLVVTAAGALTYLVIGLLATLFSRR